VMQFRRKNIRLIPLSLRGRHAPQKSDPDLENAATADRAGHNTPAASGRIYNANESPTPTLAERLAELPPSKISTDENGKFNLAQDIAYNTSCIRSELGYTEPISYAEGLRRTLA
jgi:nucleoside-diphosphate-sugar epimerase